MKLPYSHVHALGDFTFAARGGAIHSFHSVTGQHISTWKHPDAEKEAIPQAQEEAPKASEELKEDVEVEPAPPASDEPPSKRQRLDEAGEAKATDEDVGEAEEAEDQQKGPKKKKGKKAKNRARGGENHRTAQAPEKSLVVLITSTVDGKHVIAVSGHDKIIWVFEQDGQGHLKQLSQRKMPKRPVDLAIGPDGTIIAADKFGDVYSLPLLFDPSAPLTKLNLSAPTSKTFKPSATTLTVHSKRNRIALEAQLQMYEAQNLNGGNKDEAGPDAPAFDMDLLLGHVSMLTAVAIAESEGKRYILTADRDEHIRVSRYIPQAHVIEGFCLGHKEFVSAMVIPAGRGDILVSGGGETDLFVWDWKKGAKLTSASVLSLAQVVAPETTKVAVSALATLLYPTDDGSLTYVLAICEDVKAIFAWQLTEDNWLNHPSVIQLPGNPLHLAVSPQLKSPYESPRITVALDPTADASPAKSLNTFTLTMNAGRLSSEGFSGVADDGITAAEPEVNQEEIRSLLYTTEQLRKKEYGRDGDDDEPAQEGAGEETAAPEVAVE